MEADGYAIEGYGLGISSEGDGIYQPSEGWND